MNRYPLALLFAAHVLFAADEVTQAGRKQFSVYCAACHGGDAAGGERAGGLQRTSLDTEGLKRTIRRGIPGRGMPPFDFGETELDQIVAFVRSVAVKTTETFSGGDVAAGQTIFFGAGGCSKCHMIQGTGGLLGPDLSSVTKQRSLSEIEESIRNPGGTVRVGYRAATVRLRNGRTVHGVIKNESNFDLQVLDGAGALHLLGRAEIVEVQRGGSPMPPAPLKEADIRNVIAFLRGAEPVVKRASEGPASGFDRIARPRKGEWPTYNGDIGGNRHSTLDQITPGNVASLAPRWMFPIRDSQRLEVTPIVMDGVMYVTAANQVYALDAGTGRPIWQFRRDRTKALVGDAASGINRGVAIFGDRIFLTTDNAHLIALHRTTGAVLWEIEVADSREHYGTTSAPLVVKDLVITGTSGGDEGARGFFAAYRASTGEKVWQFWTVPRRGEPGSETWVGSALEHGCSTAWLTGTYDTQANLLYWTAGNPCPDYNGDERKGDNLYSNSVLALDPATGKLRWYFQFTPHDLHDWDSVQTPVLVDAPFGGRHRKLLLHANRNGFFYVLDRLTGEFLRGTPFAKQTWASGLDDKGRPKLLAGTTPTPEGVKVCPAVEGATNWMSPAYSPATGFYYVMTLDKCSIYTRAEAVWKPGQSFYGGDTRNVPGEPGTKVLRAIDLQNGKIAWEVPQLGPANSWGGVLSTTSGLLFYGDDSGAFAAVEAKTGKPLWNFHTNQLWKASPMTYMADGRQFVAVAAGSNIVAFALPETARTQSASQ